MNFFKKILLAFFRRAKSYERTEYFKKLKERGLKIGKNPKILQDVIIDESHCWHITIGDDVTFAPRVHILAHDASTKTHLNYTKIGKVTIGDRVFIGASSIVMPGVDIGDDVIIGAGSVVTHDIPSRTVAVGNPAKVVSDLDTFLEKRALEIKEYPLFDKKYTIKENVTETMREEMNRKMEDRFGYIV